ncbi:hypothetical protein BO79DRAFT_284299 [Aspergillus costaricaensis CBS 115574]|uniref:Uncharacterized protein n=1 Tax=Aspergillus costaricaensis CBS 115574 TaxID=1448317 RepID=A0ACD1ISP2_9EURO|nr:hypothetical protein BO79DRAFT_284299 [Aspergillus costaricaensis CBS 115574]RAK93737.1 hypothetical protein BO79DRAFT_284299 [Aspergillus costaricaensis CBS 115574]
MPVDFDAIWEDLLADLKTLPAISFDGFVRRIHFRARWNSDFKSLRKYIGTDQPYPAGDESHNQELDGMDTGNDFSRLGNWFLATEFMSIDDDGYWQVAMAAQLAPFLIYPIFTPGVLRGLMSMCLAEHLNTKFKSNDHPSLMELTNTTGFADYFINRIQTKSFIINLALTDPTRSDHLFSISILLVADYLYYKTAWLDIFKLLSKDRPSFKALHAWSLVTWNEQERRDEVETDNIVKNCGIAATMAYCSVLGSLSTFDALNFFYKAVMAAIDTDSFPELRPYLDSIQASLKRLIDEAAIINEFVSYSEKLYTTFYHNMSENWRDGVRNAWRERNTGALTDWVNKATDSNSRNLSPLIPVELQSSLLSGTNLNLSRSESKQIEAVANNNRFLVSTKPPRYSHEGYGTVASKSLKVCSVGFNGEKPFTTPSQVFYTTTGLRAVDPGSAKASCPHAHIGPLRRGHVIYRLAGNPDDFKYEAVEISSIEVGPKTEQNVYSVSLWAGEQSHHANGYLLAINDPNRAVEAAARALRALPPKKRISLLASFHELSSTFTKNDIQAIHERLNLELFGSYGKREEGLISRSEIFPALVSPSDQLKAMKYNPRQLPNGVPLDRIQRRFSLLAIGDSNLPSAYTLPDLSVIDDCILINDVPQMRCKVNHHRRTFQWTRRVQENMFEHGVLSLYSHGLSGKGVVLISPTDAPEDCSKKDVQAFEALPKSVAKNIQLLHAKRQAGEPESDDEGEYIPVITVSMQYDKSTWAPDEPIDEPKDPMSGMDVQWGFLYPPDGSQTTETRVPILDELRDRLNEKYNREFERLYDSWEVILDDGRTRATVEFNLASVVPFISDAGMDVNTLNVNFKSQLGIDITLPILFQSFYIDYDVDLRTVKGAIFDYNPLMRDTKGDRHYICGTSDIDDSEIYDMRLKTSRAFADCANLTAPTSVTSALHPADVTEQLHLLQEPTVDELLNPYGYDEVAREDLTGQAKPTNLDSSLAENLPSDLRKFFREKYAPAFLCQSVMRYDKYEDKFTEQEKKNMRYWWDGNGDKCLAKSKEYAEINRRASVEAVRQFNKDILDKYLDDNPTEWACTLYAALKDKGRMLTYLAHPIQGSVNVINRECCILDALAPSEGIADQWFEYFVGFASERHIHYPYIDPDEDLAGQWLHDSMKDLIQRVLEGDPSVDEDVRKGLEKDIEEFEKANGLDQTALAEARASNIVEKGAVFFAEAKMWLTAIGKGLAVALQGTRLFQLAEASFEQVTKAIGDSLPGLKKLKPIATIGMVAYYIFQLASSLYGLITGWDTMEDAKKAVVILEMIQTVVNGISQARDAWNNYKNRDTATTPEDALDTATLNQGVEKSVSESGGGLAEMSDEINGEGTFNEIVGDHVLPEGPATEGDNAGRWNEGADKPPENIPAGGEDVVSKWNVSGNAVKILNAFLGIGLVIAMTFSLVQDWDKLTTGGKIINMIALLSQTLTVVLDIVEVGSSIGLYTVTGVFATALPILGAVLAVLGVVMMLINLFVNLFGGSPPPDPVQEFIDHVAKDLVGGFEKAPPPKLDYTIPSVTYESGKVTGITIKGENTTADEISIPNARIIVTSGSDDVCLFSTNEFELVEDTDTDKDSDGHLYVTPNRKAEGTLSSSVLGDETEYHEYDLVVGGNKKDTENSLHKLILQAKESFTAVWTGKINKSGRSTVEIIEKSDLDKCHVQYTVLRI